MAYSSQLQFYLSRVAEAREQGKAATLEHVRERCRRSEAAWSALADRAARAEAMRNKREEKATQTPE